MSETQTDTPPVVSPWATKIQSVADSRHVTIATNPIGPTTPVVGAVERSIWGNSFEPPPDAPAGSPESFDSQVRDLQTQITQLRIDKGPQDPEYLEAQRLFNVAFR